MTIVRPSSGRLTRRLLILVLGLAATTVLVLPRQTGMPALLSVWAEDGWFLRDALAATPWFQPFAGYLNLVPRIMASLAAALPLEWASVVMSGGAAMLTALVALYVYRATNGPIADRKLRLWIAALTPLLPAIAFESMNNIANSQVFLQYGCAWALLSRPSTRADRIAGVVMVLAATLSSPLSVLLAPLVLLRRDRAITLAWLGGSAVQAIVIVAAGGTQTPIHAVLRWLPELYALRVVLGAGLGIRLGDEVWKLLGHGAAIVATVAVIGVAAYAVKRPNRGPVTLLFATSVAFVCRGIHPKMVGRDDPNAGLTRSRGSTTDSGTNPADLVSRRLDSRWIGPVLDGASRTHRKHLRSRD